MARDKITDKSNPPKSEWFGYKYQVTPETSKLLQEAVFKDGGGWWDSSKDVVNVKYDNFWMFVTDRGEISWSTINTGTLPKKQPPQPKKEFRQGKWYKCLDNAGAFTALTKGKWYPCTWVSIDSTSIGVDSNTMKDLRGWTALRFDINSELDYDPNIAQPAGDTAYVVFKHESKWGTEYSTKEYAYKCSRENYTQYREYRAFDEDVFALVNVSGTEKTVKVVRIEAIADPKATKSIVRILPKELAIENKKSKIDDVVKVTINRDDFFTKETLEYPTTKEENIMSNQNRVVSVKFFDDDAGLKAEQSLVAEYQITTRVSDAMTVSKVLLTEDVAGDITAHNEVRAATIDLHILKQTGNKVTLQPIEFEDLRVEVRQV